MLRHTCYKGFKKHSTSEYRRVSTTKFTVWAGTSRPTTTATHNQRPHKGQQDHQHDKKAELAAPDDQGIHRLQIPGSVVLGDLRIRGLHEIHDEAIHRSVDLPHSVPRAALTAGPPNRFLKRTLLPWSFNTMAPLPKNAQPEKANMRESNRLSKPHRKRHSAK